MACDSPREPLLSGSSNPNPQMTPAGKDNGSIPCAESIFGNLHPSIKQVAIYLTIYLGLGTLSFYLVKDDITGKKTNNLLDALYFCVVTMTTVGYGDLVPNSAATKLLACLFVFSGMALVGLIVSKAADYLVEKQEILLVKAMHLRDKTGPTEILKEATTKKAKYKCLLTAGIIGVLMVAGTVFLCQVMKLGFIDAFYCVCSTVTTLGYGDKSFSTSGGRLFAVVWIMVSTIGLAQLFLYVAEVFTESRQRALVNWVLTRKMTTGDLEAADIDCDGHVG
ncbi:unnamed protein product [Linum tenue]|uniref:Potassium channel domain-containing protein n=1 Tax=Linum tenue TaxID=586396 RepID=A0AAV0H2I1_9ROSI|nr:unnamed protein product [Linum tenue]